ncbi:hypothetical protein HDU90_006778 [Geranomyces variabilis]|nr:hypothetical protein HDU90_006778 [Geranomyces variabilis]
MQVAADTKLQEAQAQAKEYKAELDRVREALIASGQNMDEQRDDYGDDLGQYVSWWFWRHGSIRKPALIASGYDGAVCAGLTAEVQVNGIERYKDSVVVVSEAVFELKRILANARGITASKVNSIKLYVESPDGPCRQIHHDPL